MKLIKTLATALAVVLGCCTLASCEKELDPNLTLQSQTMDVAPEAGEHTLAYELTNPLEGMAVPKAISDAEWLKIISAEAGTIKFSVEENKSLEKREASILVKYSTMFTLECKVIQGASTLPVIQIASDKLTVSADGGKQSIEVKIANKVAGVEPEAKSETPWIKNFVFEGEKLNFDVDKSIETQARKSEIVISYKGGESVKIAVTQEASNIVMLGEPANCYIVSKEGLYGFETKLVDGTAIEGIESADWIWTTKANEVIKDINYFNGVISFTATGKTGNATIAALNADKEIVWSWHIWATPQPELLTYEKTGAVVMDRYLGATTTGWESLDALGVLYQWGRKDPFWGTNKERTTEKDDCIWDQANDMTTMNPNLKIDGKAPAWSYIGERGKGTTIENSIKNPVCMWADQSTKDYHWLAVSDTTLWNKVKTNYDPCPAGYRVGSKDDWKDFTKETFKWDAEKVAFAYQVGEKTDWWPVNGVREDKSGCLVLWQSLIVWNCDNEPMLNWDTWQNDWFGSRINCGPYMVQSHAVGNRSFAQAVRCVQIKK